MTDIHELKKGDRIIFTNGHESPVYDVSEDVKGINIRFTNEKGKALELFFFKHNGIAPWTEYEIAKVINNGSD